MFFFLFKKKIVLFFYLFIDLFGFMFFFEIVIFWILECNFEIYFET